MLQQTQVKTVVPYFERFITRFPDVEALASATEEEVLAVWSGLGYYRRARALHEAAQRVVEEWGGCFREDAESWMTLPGVGRYTAGAVVSIAFGTRAPILDGNVARVLARVFEVHGDPRSGEAKRRLWSLAEEILPDGSVSDFNQALMELGALVCTPRKPRCLVCPLREGCDANRLGLTTTLPDPPPRAESVRVSLTAAVVEERGRMLMYRRDGDDLMRGLWEFPGGACRTGEAPRAAVAREARERYGLSLTPGEPLATVQHSIMNRRIALHAFSAELDVRPRRESEPRWVSERELASLPVSSMVLKVLRARGRS